MTFPKWVAEHQLSYLPKFLRCMTPGADASPQTLMKHAFVVGLALSMPPPESTFDAVAQDEALRMGEVEQYAATRSGSWGDQVMRTLERRFGENGERFPVRDPLGEAWTTVMFAGFVFGVLHDCQSA